MRGAREGASSRLRRLLAAALARDLSAFVLPGADVARARGLNLRAVGLRQATTPRHAGVLLIAGPLPAGLRDAASVVYAQMPRPRAILALGAGEIAPLPAADVSGELSQQGLTTALANLRQVIAGGVFAREVTDFEAPALQARIEYTCPMHPEVVSDEPGNCPKCGMALAPREAAADSPHAAYTMPGNQPAMSSVMPSSHASPASEDPVHGTDVARYTCPMHPEVVADKPGSCPICGMPLVPLQNTGGHHGHGGEAADGGDGNQAGHSRHAAHGGQEAAIDGIEAHFMSMVELTKNMPASGDGLKMEWIDVPFGPFFPGLPSGLDLTLTLDGDTVAGSRVRSLAGADTVLCGGEMTPQAFTDHFAALSPLSPVAYRQLACLALESAAGLKLPSKSTLARLGAVERERIASHLGWLTGFGAQIGFGWLEARAAALQLKMRAAAAAEIVAMAPTVTALLRRLHRTPLLRAKLSGIGQVSEDGTTGPVARASGGGADARSADPAYVALGFSALTGTRGDALARLSQRTGEITQSLDLIARAGVIGLPEPAVVGAASGSGEAVVETPRGSARLTLTLTSGQVTAAEVQMPSAAHAALIAGMTNRRELGDALVAVGSLDLSPWEMPA